MTESKISSVKVLFCAVLFATLFISWSANPPQGRTGAPGDGLCSDCHSGSNPNGYDGGITIQNFPSTIVGGQTYSLTATVSNPNGLAALAGFQAVVLDNANSNVGDITNVGSNAQADTNGAGREYVAHSPAQPFSVSNDFVWSFDWVAPTSPNGEQITIYAAGNIASGSNGNQSDFIVTTTATGTLMGTPALQVSTVVNNNVSCFAGNDGNATATGSGGTPNYSYAWSNGETTQTAVSLTVGIFTVTVTDANLNEATATVTITEPTEFNLTLDNKIDIDCNTVTGTATLSGSGGTGAYIYNWPSGNQTATETGLAAGVYTITAVDSNGCQDDVNFTINDNSTPPNADAGSDVALTCTTTQINLDGTSSDVGPEFSYQWTTTGGNIVSGDQTLTPTIDAAGSYTLIVMNNNSGCISSDNVQATSDPIPGITLSATNVSCSGGSDGTIELTVNGGVMPFMFDWDNDNLDGIEDPGNLAAGTYSVTVTDGNGCEASGSISVAEPAAMVLSVTATQPSCFDTCDGSIDLTVTGGTLPMTILWSDASASTSEDLTGICSGNYSVTVTDANGCIKITSIDVGIPSAITISSTSTVETCAGLCDGTITLTVSGGTGSYTYQWQNDPTTSNTITGCPGSYMVTVTDGNGCFAIHTEDITGPDSLIVNATIVDASCFEECDGSIEITTTGGTGTISYEWSNGEVDDFIFDLCSADYTITATDANGCETVKVFTVDEPDEILIAETITNAGCFGECFGEITIVVTGGTEPYIYDWENNPGASTNINNLCAGSYALTVTDALNCESVSIFTVSEDAALITMMSSTNETTAGASDGTATANINGIVSDFTFLWSNNASTDAITGLSPGNYEVTVTSNITGCVEINSVVVNSFNCDLTATISSTTVSCNGDADGTATVQGENGTMPYAFIWSTGGTSMTESNLPAGIVFCTISDANGCSEVLSIEVDSPDELTGTSTATDILCFGSCDGSISLDLFGGTQPYFIVPNSLNDLCAGDYDITVTDARGCEFLISETILEPAALNINMSATDVSAVGGMDGTASATTSGGVGNLSYLWDNNEVSAMIGNLAEGEYCVTVTDGNNCMAESCVTVGSSACDVELMVQTTIPSCAGESDGTAMAAPTGGLAPFTYTWSSSTNQTDTETNLSIGTYTVTITDGNGCEDVESFEINDGPSLSLSIVSIAPTSCNGDCDGSVELASPNYTYTWPDNTTGFMRQDLCAGSYDVTATDGTCSDVIAVTITEPSPISLFMSNTDETSTGAADGTASAFPTGSTGNFLFLWSSGQSTQMISGLTPGNYCVTVTSESGCEESDCIIVSSAGCDLAVTLSQNGTTCFDSCDGELIASIMGGTAPYAYAWSNSVPAEDTINNLCAGNYALTVTDAAGCIAEASGTITESNQIIVEADIMNWDASCSLPCNGGSVFLNVTGNGPFNYDWNIDSLDGTNGATGLCPDIYSCTITDGNGCTLVYETPQPTMSNPIEISVQTFDACFGSCDGEVVFAISGGVPPYNITTDLPANFSEICPGDYFITVVDEDGCENISSFTVGESLELTVSVDTIGSASSAGGGFVNISVMGTAPFLYEWILNGEIASMEEDPQDLAAGNYTLIIEDDNGCDIETTVTVPQSTSTNDVLIGENIQVYPNPANDVVNISIKLNRSENVEIIFYDMLGNNIYELKNWKGTHLQEVINTSAFSSGLYTVLIKSNNEYWTEKLVIINKG